MRLNPCQSHINTVSSPYHLRVYRYGLGTELVWTWHGVGTDLVISG